MKWLSPLTQSAARQDECRRFILLGFSLETPRRPCVHAKDEWRRFHFLSSSRNIYCRGGVIGQVGLDGTRCTPHSAGSGGHSSLSTVIGWIAIALTPSSPQCTVISYRHSSHRRGQQRIRLTRWLIKARHENDNNNTISTFLPYQQGRHLRGGGVWLLPIYLWSGYNTLDHSYALT